MCHITGPRPDENFTDSAFVLFDDISNEKMSKGLYRAFSVIKDAKCVPPTKTSLVP